MSAIWHGFYTGYYSFFIFAGLLDYLAKIATPVLNPLFEGWCPWPIQYIMLYVWSYVNCGYAASAFVLLSFDRFHKLYSSMYYIGHI